MILISAISMENHQKLQQQLKQNKYNNHQLLLINMKIYLMIFKMQTHQ